MYRLEREGFLSYPFIFLWALLGFQAGFLNSFGFLACGRYVSHVTGFGTQIGLAIGDQRMSLAIELLGFPISFIAGAMVNGFLTSARLERNLRPRYDLVTMFLPFALVSVMFIGTRGWLGPINQTSSQMHDLILLFGLSFLCGLQNGCFATMTRGQIRTTHLTGISTDIGTDLARIFFGKLDTFERRYVRRANISRALTFLGFALGAILSVIATESVDYYALGIPVLTATVTYLIVMRISHAMDQKVVRASSHTVRPVTEPELAASFDGHRI